MKKQVLVLCTGNSARSQMAEAIINKYRGDQWHAVSAGTQLAAQVNPYAVCVLEEIGIDCAHCMPKHVNSFSGQSFDMVITVCDDAAENCPMWPGQGERLHISFPDPARAQGDDTAKVAVFRTVRDDIERRILAALDG